MVDEIYLGYALAAITVAAPVLLYFALSGLPSATALDAVPGQPNMALDKSALEIMPVLQSMHNEMNNIDYEHNDPEQVLRLAYEQRAQSEVDRCTGESSYKDLCNDTMGLLIDSCADSTMYVAACDDPRLAQYKPHVLNN